MSDTDRLRARSQEGHRGGAREVVQAARDLRAEAARMSSWQAFDIDRVTVRVRKETPVLDGIVDAVGVEMSRARPTEGAREGQGDLRFRGGAPAPAPPGKCRELHGHSYRLVVTVGPSGRARRRAWRSTSADLEADRQPGGRGPARSHATSTTRSTNPTAEVMAVWIWNAASRAALRARPRSSCGRRAAARSSTGGSDGRNQDGSGHPAVPRGIGRALSQATISTRRPRRVARAWSDDLVSGYAVDPAAELTYVGALRGERSVVLKDIRFASVCVHHLLPFAGLGPRGLPPGGAAGGLVEARPRGRCPLPAAADPGASDREHRRHDRDRARARGRCSSCSTPSTPA